MKCVCELCGSKEAIQVDHVVHFDKLVQDFIDEYNYKDRLPQEFDDCKTTYVAIFKECNKELEEQWCNYYKDKAMLRPLCRTCNLTRPKYRKAT